MNILNELFAISEELTGEPATGLLIEVTNGIVCACFIDPERRPTQQITTFPVELGPEHLHPWLQRLFEESR